jgi:hypothetical protein
MATTDQMQTLLQQNAEFLVRIQREQHEAMQAFMGQVMSQVESLVSSSRPPPPRMGLDDRKFKDLTSFEGVTEAWQEWSLKFKATVKEANLETFNVMRWAEGEVVEITEDTLEETFGDQGNTASAGIYGRLIHKLSGPAWTIHQSVADENGAEVWRKLSRRYNPRTPLRGLQLMLKVMGPGKAKKDVDIQTHINSWESTINVLEHDFSEKISEMAKIGLLLSMLPRDLQEMVLQQSDRLKEYKDVKDKVVNIVDARARLRDPDAMDVGSAEWEGYDHDWSSGGQGQEPGEDRNRDVDMIGGSWGQCFRCGGQGHRAVECGTPKGKGKDAGKGKGTWGQGAGAWTQGKGAWGKGKGKGTGKGKGKGTGKGALKCSHCGKPGHEQSTCWTLHPEQMPWNANNVEEEYYQEAGGEEIEMGSVEVSKQTHEHKHEQEHEHKHKQEVSKQTHEHKHEQEHEHEQCIQSKFKQRRTSKTTSNKQPGKHASQASQASLGKHIFRGENRAVRVANRFAPLAGEVDVGNIALERMVEVVSLDVEVPIGVNQVTHNKLKSAGVGKITIDSGAGESVMPKGMMVNEPLTESEAQRQGTKYVAANGSKMNNYGEKRVRFRQQGGAVGAIKFQVSDVNKPLASVSRILEKGNTVFFSQKGSYITNVATGKKTELFEERGTFVMNVEFLEPDSGFPRQGSK